MKTIETSVQSSFVLCSKSIFYFVTHSYDVQTCARVALKNNRRRNQRNKLVSADSRKGHSDDDDTLLILSQLIES